MIFSVLMYNQEVTEGCFGVQLYPTRPYAPLSHSIILISFSYKELRNGSGMVILTKHTNDNVVVNSNTYRKFLSIYYNNRASLWEKLFLEFQSYYRSL